MRFIGNSSTFSLEPLLSVQIVENRNSAAQTSPGETSVGLAKGGCLWETVPMPKRNLRIARRVRNVPVLGVCENCNAQFSGDPNMGNAQSAIQAQFNAHKCQRQDFSQAATGVRESSESGAERPARKP